MVLMRAMAAILGALAGCSQVQPFYCDADEQCRDGETRGVCSIYGVCAFPDPSCPDFGLRYHDSAGELSGVCVGDEGDFDPPGDCEPGPEFCGDGEDSDCFEDQDPACPLGDVPESAIDLTEELSTYVDIRYGGNEYTPSCASPGGRDAFFELTLAEEQLVYVDTFGTGFHAVIAVRAGACADQGDFSAPEIACVVDSCTEEIAQWIEYLEAGSYCIVVDQYDEDEAAFADGDLEVNVKIGPADAEILEVGLHEGTTCDADDEWSSDCGAVGATDATFALPLCQQTISLAADTCASPGFSAALSAHDGYGDVIACGDGCTGGSGLSVDLTGPDLFFLVVEASAGECGAFALDAAF
jgi:hypothetical protein